MKQNAPKKTYFIVCNTSRWDMIPTGYFDFDAKIVVKKESAAKFDQLNEALNFVQKHKIKLDDSCYIGLFG